ncbi:DNA-binding transcriptional ArsR family regulator [Allocatelliglobosispora scoriae]|uniref:DNA-binding transcriptional ArsR family regulator n=1 Tax=Allocatelliglobosispora scoriae TaxID=643052 RepID=A0A841C3W3_9ACTN|nr:winged helix-turn-helix domain-containing protein [Allocatelliglobosispora scoriae]MBB5873752.1 DNA-binding transcriptional ArsR family regulator [Allocatelliglobosispora scoriae]
MLRIVFTSEDIARTRIASQPDPGWEMIMGLQMLRRQQGDLLFTEWRQTSLAELKAKVPRDELRLLLALSPTIGYYPDFLTPAESARGLEYGLEAIRSTPIPMLGRDLRRLAERNSKLPPGIPELVRGEPAALKRLTDSMRAFHSLAIAPHQPRIDSAIDRDRGQRMREMMNGGVEALLNSLRPMASYSGGELRVPAHRDQEVHLGGRGLTLIPSYFNLVQPVTLFDPELPPVLIYPVERPPGTIVTVEAKENGSLGPLIGQTRSAMLYAIGTGATTSDLARRAAISVASASEHATILRDARLITSHRDRNRMVHQLTRLGMELLRND